MANVAPGISYTPTILVLDASGTPVTAGVSGTMSLYGPTGTTALGSGSVSHQGGGQWGSTFTGDLLSAQGTYRYTVPTLTVPGGNRYNQGGVFDVGTSNLPTVADLYVLVRRGLPDGVSGTTTASGSTTTLIDTDRFKRGSAGDWVGSEVYLLNPPNSTDDNPLYVTAFDPTTGTLTFANNVITSTVSGLRFIIGNLAGVGWSHDRVLDALQLALRRSGGGAQLTDETSLTYTSTTFEYAAPTTFDTVTQLDYQPPGAYTGQWVGVAPRYWEWQDGRGLIVFKHATGARYYRYGNRSPVGAGFTIPQGSRLRIMGAATATAPLGFNQPVNVDPVKVRDLALIDLLMQRPEAEHRQRAAMLAGQMGRPTVRMPG